ncbi:hypothetical protein TNCV_3914901 [Trichonephila clavipes]|nr:hypothetical protein TNCV_3914901 [Trichonephila clavipes]
MDCTLESKCVNCTESHSSNSKLCPKWKTENEIQAQLLPSTSSVTVTSPSKSQPPTSVTDTAPTTSNNLSISAASFSSTACHVLETTTITSNTISTTSQDANQTSKPRRKKSPPKNQSNTIKRKLEIKMAPHKPRKSAPTEYTTDEEDMIVYDVDDEPEPNPKYVLNIDSYTYKGELINNLIVRLFTTTLIIQSENRVRKRARS